MEKFWGPQIGSEIRVFAIFSKLHHQFPLMLHKTMSDIQQSCGPNSGPDDLLYANLVEHPLKLACFIGIQSCSLLLVFKYFLYVSLSFLSVDNCISQELTVHCPNVYICIYGCKLSVSNLTFRQTSTGRRYWKMIGFMFL